MTELAYNIQGDPFEVPAAATAWRVRKMKQKGAPEVVYGRDGLPLMLPIEAGIEELRAEVSSPGRYRLDPMADDQRPLAEATSAYVFLHPDAEPQGGGGGGARGGARLDAVEAMLAEITRANLETTRANSTLAQTVIERFAGMVESAAVLVRAAGGVPVSAAPIVLAAAAEPDGDDDDDDDEAEDGVAEAPMGLDVHALVAQVVTSVVTAVCSGQMKLPGLRGLLDWRKAAPAASAEAPSAAPSPAPGAEPAANRPASRPTAATTAAPPMTTAPSTTAATEPQPQPTAEASAPKGTSASEVLATLSPMAMGKLMVVQQALTPDERTLALAVLRELTPAELNAWALELTQLPMEAAVAKIRKVLHRAPSAPDGAS